MTLSSALLKDFRFRVAVVIALSVLIFAVWLLLNRHKVETDNAIVRCDVTDVVSEVAGVIREIRFEDNQLVRGGELIAKIDEQAFRATKDKRGAELQAAKTALVTALENRSLTQIAARTNVARARALLGASHSAVRALELEIEEAAANLKVGATKVEFEQSNSERTRQLYAKHFVSQKHLDDALRDYRLNVDAQTALESRLKLAAAKVESERSVMQEKSATYEQARAAVSSTLASAEAAVNAAQRQIEVAQAEYELAQIQLEKSNIKALRMGSVTNRRVAVGDYVEPGQPIASITSCAERAWVEANFKETQIGRMVPGQRALITVDTYPDKTFIGTVESLATGSGSTFSVLPPENATGNFTKVVQRFPVKIALSKSDQAQLRVGMSALVTVLVDDAGTPPSIRGESEL